MMIDLSQKMVKVLAMMKLEICHDFDWKVYTNNFYQDILFVRGNGSSFVHAGLYNDIASWEFNSIVNHLCVVLGIHREQKKEIVTVDTEKIQKLGEDDAAMWIALINPYMPPTQLRRFTRFCAATRGLQSVEANDAYADGFWRVFDDYYTANKPKEITDGKG
jgi:hypothetical protein